ncbi:hypothetical protein FQA39_LY12976 [Lamprigera yunnana]|nr:hypothetical protein FQA39_LY12976 [Lamprigera yunnana]
MKTGIYLQQYAQNNPLAEYVEQATKLFNQMKVNIAQEAVVQLANVVLKNVEAKPKQIEITDSDIDKILNETGLSKENINAKDINARFDELEAKHVDDKEKIKTIKVPTRFNFKPAGDQISAIEEISTRLNNNQKHQVLLGATGTGKTFTMANIIAKRNTPTLVLAHNKTLAMQLYFELKEFFPDNRVEYFVSNFDFFQPEAYLPSKDLYIDKDARQNMELDMMRMSAMNALSIRNDTIVVASVAAIYGAQNPQEYSDSFFELEINQKISKRNLLLYLVKTGYKNNEIENAPGTFLLKVIAELKDRLEILKAEGKLLEYQRLEQRTNYDLESLEEFGVCSGIENYSAHLDMRKPGERPCTLLDYFKGDFLTIIDESHMMIPQLNAMYKTDRSRKETLVEYGFRLPSALDNRPLRFDEFTSLLKQVVYTSATPGDYELELTNNIVTQQIIRPTGLLDPEIQIKPTENQIEDIIEQIHIRREKNQRVFITTLTIRMSEDLTTYLQEQRSDILMDLRRGVYDAVVGVNLLREGLDCPEVSLVCILDADKQGFLRNTRSLIQTTGRAARNAEGRREIQSKYNKEHNIVPKTIIKNISEASYSTQTKENLLKIKKAKSKKQKIDLLEKTINQLRDQMIAAAKELDFETAASIRDTIIELESEKEVPKDKLVVFTGLSGSGKSSLAFSTIYAEGRRRYIESLSAYARQFLGGNEKPDVDSIEGLSPAISIDQKTTSHNPRSTVGTVTEIYDYLRLLYARVGTPYCINGHGIINTSSIKEIVNNIKSLSSDDEQFFILAPVVRDKKGTHKDILEKLKLEGFIRIVVNDKEDKQFSTTYSCGVCGFNIPELEPRLFSFNAPLGACKECDGLGVSLEASPDLILNEELTINQGGVVYYKNLVGSENLD